MKNKTLRGILTVFAALVLVIGGYLAYVLLAYDRLPDGQALAVTGQAARSAVPVDRPLTALSYNIGFAAYRPDFGFFMDGGDESRAESPASVREVLRGVADLVTGRDPDIVLLQEVDSGSTRSWQIRQDQILTEALGAGRSASYAVNYDSPYLFWPLLEPHGASRSGMLTLSRWGISSAVRTSLPVETSLYKLLDLDRCYAAHRIPVENGKELVVYALHLSAYTSDGAVATEQLKLLLRDMAAEYEKGNYVLAGGDFNKDLLGDSSQYFGVSADGLTWAQPFPRQLLEGTGITLRAPSNAPSCRNADGPYHPDQFVLTVDGFLTSENIRVESVATLDTDFTWSDHEPVELRFTLVP